MTAKPRVFSPAKSDSSTRTCLEQCPRSNCALGDDFSRCFSIASSSATPLPLVHKICSEDNQVAFKLGRGRGCRHHPIPGHKPLPCHLHARLPLRKLQQQSLQSLATEEAQLSAPATICHAVAGFFSCERSQPYGHRMRHALSQNSSQQSSWDGRAFDSLPACDMWLQWLSTFCINRGMQLAVSVSVTSAPKSAAQMPANPSACSQLKHFASSQLPCIAHNCRKKIKEKGNRLASERS